MSSSPKICLVAGSRPPLPQDAWRGIWTMQHLSLDAESVLSPLESLPGELLDIVFNQVWSEESQVVHPASPALKPYFQRNLYRSIKLDYPHFLRPCTDSLRHASLFKTLKIDGAHAATTDYQTEHGYTIYNFFKSATSLQSIATSPSYPPLHFHILSTISSLIPSSTLASLTLQIPCDAIRNRRNDVPYLSAFNRVQQLKVKESIMNLGLDAEQAAYSAEENRVGSVRSGSVVEDLSLTFLSLEIWSPGAFVTLVGRCQNLESLELDLRSHAVPGGIARPHAFLLHLDAIANPLKIKSLSLKDSLGPSGGSLNLERFANLEHVKLIHYQELEDRINIISEFKEVKTIEIRRWSTIDRSLIHTLLHPATRPHTNLMDV